MGYKSHAQRKAVHASKAEQKAKGVSMKKYGASKKDFPEIKEKNQGLINKIYGEKESYDNQQIHNRPVDLNIDTEDKLQDKYEYVETIEEEETLSLQDKEVEMIKQALIRTNGKRKNAAKELGISERTLYRKIKQHNLGDVSEL